MYKVIKRFRDLEDGGHIYNVGDAFPRDGANVSRDRITKLSSDQNKQKVPLIVKVVKGNADTDLSGDKKLVRSRAAKVVRQDNDQ